MQPKFVRDLETRINDTMHSIKAIKGADFAEATHCLFKGTHATANLGLVLHQSDISESVRSKLTDQLNNCMSSHMNLIVNLIGLQEKDVIEMMSWVDVMHKHVHTAMEEAT